MNEIDLKEKYVKDWNESSKHHSDNGDYEWICGMLEADLFPAILEIGCGSGQSTLAWLRQGHQVIAIDCIKECVDNALECLENEGFYAERFCDEDDPNDLQNEYDAIFGQLDIFEESAIQRLLQFKIDAVVLCNPGLGTATTEVLKKLLTLGVRYDEIIDENGKFDAYGIKIGLILQAGRVASMLKKPLLVVDRELEDNSLDEEISDNAHRIRMNFCKHERRKTTALSLKGQALLDGNGNKQKADIIDINLVSVIYTP